MEIERARAWSTIHADARKKTWITHTVTINDWTSRRHGNRHTMCMRYYGKYRNNRHHAHHQPPVSSAMGIWNEWVSIHSVVGGVYCRQASSTSPHSQRVHTWTHHTVSHYSRRRERACVSESQRAHKHPSHFQCAGKSRYTNKSAMDAEPERRSFRACVCVCVSAAVNERKLAELVSCYAWANDRTHFAFVCFYFYFSLLLFLVRLRLINNSTQFLRGHVFIYKFSTCACTMYVRAFVRSQCTKRRAQSTRE